MRWIARNRGPYTVYQCDGYTIQCVRQLWALTHPDGTESRHDTFHAARVAAEDDAGSVRKRERG